MNSDQVLAAHGLDWQLLQHNGYDTVCVHMPGFRFCDPRPSTYCLTCRKQPLSRNVPAGHTAIKMTRRNAYGT